MVAGVSNGGETGTRLEAVAAWAPWLGRAVERDAEGGADPVRGEVKQRFV